VTPCRVEWIGVDVDHGGTCRDCNTNGRSPAFHPYARLHGRVKSLSTRP
jgi:hypothetical protein